MASTKKSFNSYLKSKKKNDLACPVRLFVFSTKQTLQRLLQGFRRKNLSSFIINLLSTVKRLPNGLRVRRYQVTRALFRLPERDVHKYMTRSVLQ